MLRPQVPFYQHLSHHRKCPTHPYHDMTKICMSADCIEPMCDRCVTEHIAIHNQLATAPLIKSIE